MTDSFAMWSFFATLLVLAAAQRPPLPRPNAEFCDTQFGLSIAKGVTLYINYAEMTADSADAPFDESYDEAIQEGEFVMCLDVGYAYFMQIGCTLLDKTIVNVGSTVDLDGRKYICRVSPNSRAFLVLNEFEGDAFCMAGKVQYELAQQWIEGETVHSCQIDSETKLLTVVDDRCRVGQQDFAPDDSKSMLQYGMFGNMNCQRLDDGSVVVRRYLELACVHEDGTLYKTSDIISGRSPLNVPEDAYPSVGLIKCICKWDFCYWNVHGCRYGDDETVLREGETVTIDTGTYMCIDTSGARLGQATKKELAMIPNPTCTQGNAEHNLGDKWTVENVVYTCKLTNDGSADPTAVYPLYCQKNGVLQGGEYKQIGNEGWFLCKSEFTDGKRNLTLATIPNPTCTQGDAEYNSGDKWTVENVVYTCKLSYDSSSDLTAVYPLYCQKLWRKLYGGEYKQVGNEGWFLCKEEFTDQKHSLTLLQCSSEADCSQKAQAPPPSP